MNEFSFINVAFAAGDAAAAEVAKPTSTATETMATQPEKPAAAEKGGLQINLYTVAFQALNFLILLVVLNLILYKPLVKLLQEREKKIRKGVENAEKAEGMLKESHLIREDMIKSAKTETQAMLEKARVAGEKVKADIMTQAQKEADHVVKSGHTLIDMEREKATEDFKGRAVDMVIRTTEKVLREKLKDQKDVQLIKDSLSSLA